MKLNYRFDKHFTVDQVDLLLPELRNILHEIRCMVFPEKWKSGLEVSYEGYPRQEREKFAYSLLNHLMKAGIVIQDIERGLIDFPFIKEGKEVFLCYELNDGGTVGYYHEIDAGFAGRKSLERPE